VHRSGEKETALNCDSKTQVLLRFRKSAKYIFHSLSPHQKEIFCLKETPDVHLTSFK